MTEPAMKKTEGYSDEEILNADLNLQTALVEWPEMARFFARGVLIKVEQSMSLIDVASSFVLDKTSQVSGWLGSGEVTLVSEDDARDWQSRKPLLWCVVAAPWVLVQEKPGSSEGEKIH